MRQTLIISPSVKMYDDGHNLFMDIKAVEGLQLYAKLWDGKVRCLMRLGKRSELAFGQWYTESDLGFDVEVVGDDLLGSKALFEDAAIILAAGDNHHDLNVVAINDCPVVFIIENTLATRLQILKLEEKSLFELLRSALWTFLTEWKRRRAFAKAAGIQANGTPAFDAYRNLTAAPLLYFDTRVSDGEVVTDSQIEQKVQSCINGEPLRMAFSGRLEPLKGVDHLVPILRTLTKNGMRFTFDIFGSGSLTEVMKEAVRLSGLNDRVVFHGAVPFHEVLLPYFKACVDLFICCHRQADPSCTYMETLACGVPIVGYDNAAFRGVLELGDIGESVPMDDTDSVTKAILALDQDRSRLTAMAVSAAEVARKHSFNATYQRRIQHLEHLALR